ncbi:MAG: MFS transporter [Planctomycetota bacterium]|nr:MFS transporter [Planctomycetota bacterium]
MTDESQDRPGDIPPEDPANVPEDVVEFPEEEPPGPPEKKDGNFIIEYFRNFSVLKETRGEYWGMQVINFIDHTILFAVYTIAVLYFSTGTDKYGFGMSDAAAGYVYTIFGSLTTICLFFSGLVSDWLGIRRSMYVNQGVLLFIRAALVWVTFNQILFAGDVQMRIADGQQFCIIDRSGADGTPAVTGGGGRGDRIAEQLGLADLQPISAPTGEGAERMDGAWYAGEVQMKPVLDPVRNLRGVIGRINEAEENELTPGKEKVKAALAKDGQSLRLEDRTEGPGTLTVAGAPGSTAAVDLGIAGTADEEGRLVGEPFFPQGSSTRLDNLHDGAGVQRSDFETDLIITAADGTVIEVNLGKMRVDIGRGTSLAKLDEGRGIHITDPEPVERIRGLLTRINRAEGNAGKVTAKVETIGEEEHRLVLTDHAGGEGRLAVANAPNSSAATDLGLTGQATGGELTGSIVLPGGTRTKLGNIGEQGVRGAEDGPDLIITASDGTNLSIELGELPRDVLRVTTATGEAYDIDLTGVNSVSGVMARFDDGSGGWGWLLMSVIFVLQAPFLAIGQTAFQAANKRFTTARSRSAGFNLWYLFMNVGAFFSGLLIDLIFIGLDLPRVHVFTVGIGTAIVCLFCITFFVRREEQLRSPDEEARAAEAEADAEEIEEPDAKLEEPGSKKKRQTGKRMNPWQNFLAVAREPVFWRFTCLITLLIPVRSVFLYMHLMMPKFWTRVIGPDAFIGLLTSINPFLVILGLILLIPILNRFSVYKMLTYGAVVSGLSLFILALPPMGKLEWLSWWPWLQSNLAGVAGFTYIMSIVSLVILTIGEVIWSPRLTEYTAAIAPEGQEGTYLGFSMIPYFLAKTFVAAMSGLMLEYWCTKPPEDNQLAVRETLETSLAAGEIDYWTSPWAMWFVLAVPAVGGPIIALLMRGWFTKGAHFKHGEHTE